MNLLPDIIIIDFCEWLKKNIIPQHNDVDFLDLILDERYYTDIQKYASNFLQRYKPSVKGMLYQFIESEYFDKSLKRCDDYLREYYDLPYEWWSDYDFFYRIFHKEFFQEGFYQFYKSTYADFVYKCKGNQTRNISPQELVNSSRNLFSHINYDPWVQNERKWALQYINRLDLDLHIESDFLEWLIKTNGEPIDIRKMPLSVFEKIADKFKIDCNKSNKDRDKLIKSFKQKDLIVLSEKLLTVLPIKTARRAKDLGYIIERYQDKNIPYKCLIMPLQADSKEYVDLIEKRWEDIHYLSGNYLDIYYSAVDYGKSGYEIMNQINFIPDRLKAKVPVIVIWNTDLNNAQGIDINRLNNADIFDVIRTIVNSIKNKNSLSKIVEEANQMTKKLREEHRAINYNTINNNGTITGNVAAVNYGVMSASIAEEIYDIKLINEIEKARKIIESFEDINEIQKQRLLSIMDETKSAVELNVDEKQKESKKNFKDAICFMGNLGVKLISALSGLTNLLKFFGFSQV